MKQRVVIAIALACDPELLIADELTTALDVTIQAQVLELIRNLQQEHQMAMILITHDFGIVAETCDEIAVVYAGQIVEYGTMYHQAGFRPKAAPLYAGAVRLHSEADRKCGASAQH